MAQEFLVKITNPKLAMALSSQSRQIRSWTGAAIPGTALLTTASTAGCMAAATGIF
jgi:hypothetical protein